MISQLDEEKLFYERFYALHRDAELMRVLERFGISAFRRSCVLEGLDEFLGCCNVSGKRCLEIGTLKGLTATVLSRRFETVVSVDIHPDHDKHAIAGFLQRRNVEFIDAADEEDKARFVASEIHACDFAFVDGDHARRTESDFDLVRSCGRVLFHEYWHAQPAVMRLVDRLLRDGGTVRTKGKFALWTA